MEKIPKGFWEDAKWAEKHMPDSQKKYLEKWVAIVDRKVADDHGIAEEIAKS